MHGPYWQRCAESLYSGQVVANPGTTDVAALARAAEGFYRAGQIDDALTAYDRAAAQSHAAGRDEQSFALGYAAAAIEHERQHFAAAAERYRQVAIAHPALPKASEAHLMAAYDAGQEVRGESPDALAHYARLLDEHLATWPREPTADRARIWLSRVYEHDRQWQRAIDLLSAVRPGSESSSAAIEGLARAYPELLAELRAAGKPTAPRALAASAALDTAVRGEKIDDIDSIANRRRAVLAAAKILLEYTDDGFAKAERLLAPALEQSDDAPAEWKASAQALLVFAVAAQGRIEDAERHVENLSGAGPQALQTLVDGLDRATATAKPELKRNLATLELRILELIGQRAASDEEQRTLAPAGARRLSRRVVRTRPSRSCRTR